MNLYRYIYYVLTYLFNNFILELLVIGDSS